MVQPQPHTGKFPHLNFHRPFRQRGLDLGKLSLDGELRELSVLVGPVAQIIPVPRLSQSQTSVNFLRGKPTQGAFIVRLYKSRS